MLSTSSPLASRLDKRVGARAPSAKTLTSLLLSSAAGPTGAGAGPEEGELSSFQLSEALAYADAGGRLAEWPSAVSSPATRGGASSSRGNAATINTTINTANAITNTANAAASSTRAGPAQDLGVALYNARDVIFRSVVSEDTPNRPPTAEYNPSSGTPTNTTNTSSSSSSSSSAASRAGVGSASVRNSGVNRRASPIVRSNLVPSSPLGGNNTPSSRDNSTPISEGMAGTNANASSSSSSVAMPTAVLQSKSSFSSPPRSNSAPAGQVTGSAPVPVGGGPDKPLRAPLLHRVARMRRAQQQQQQQGAAVPNSPVESSTTTIEPATALAGDTIDLGQGRTEQEAALSPEDILAAKRRELLEKAEKLQAQMKAAVTFPTATNGSSSTTATVTVALESDVVDALIRHEAIGLTSKPNTIMNITGATAFQHPERLMDAAGIEWLLRGLPDLCYNEEEEELFRETPDNEVIAKILKEGGPPPSQLQYPSLYAESQKRMGKLPLAKRFRINLTSLLVYSAKFGMRKDNSFVIIHLPAGVKDPNYESGSTIVVPLHELKPSNVAASRSKIRKAVNVLQDYFVGKVSFGLDKSFHWDIELSDSVVCDWMSTRLPYCKGDLSNISAHRRGFIRIEFVSMLTPTEGLRRAKTRQSSGPAGSNDPMSNAVCVGYLDVPLCGLLNASRNFDVLVSSQVLLDPSTHSAISQRLERLPTSPSAQFANAAVDDVAGENQFLGTLNLRMSLLDHFGAVLPIEDQSSAQTPIDEAASTKSRDIHQISTRDASAVVEKLPLAAVVPAELTTNKHEDVASADSGRQTSREIAFQAASDFVPSEPPPRPTIEYAPLASAIAPAARPAAYRKLALTLRSLALDIGHVVKTSVAALGDEFRRVDSSVSIDFKLPSENASIREHFECSLDSLGMSPDYIDLLCEEEDNVECAGFIRTVTVNTTYVMHVPVDEKGEIQLSKLVFEVNFASGGSSHRKLLGIAKTESLEPMNHRVPIRELSTGFALGMIDLFITDSDIVEELPSITHDQQASQPEPYIDAEPPQQQSLSSNPRVRLGDYDGLDLSAVLDSSDFHDSLLRPRSDAIPEPQALPSPMSQRTATAENDDSVDIMPKLMSSAEPITGFQRKNALLDEGTISISTSHPSSAGAVAVNDAMGLRFSVEPNVDADLLPLHRRQRRMQTSVSTSAEGALDISSVRDSISLFSVNGADLLSTLLDNATFAIEVSVEGLAPDIESGTASALPPLGYFVLMSVPGLCSQTSEDPSNDLSKFLQGTDYSHCHVLWWDKCCAILNGRKQFDFHFRMHSDDVKDVRDSKAFELLWTKSVAAALVGNAFDETIPIYLFPSNSDGGFDSTKGLAPMAMAELRVSDFVSILRNSESREIRLPIHQKAGALLDDNQYVILTVSSRVLPPVAAASQSVNASMSINKSISLVRGSQTLKMLSPARVSYNNSVLRASFNRESEQQLLQEEESFTGPRLELSLTSLAHFTELGALKSLWWKSYLGARPLIFFTGQVSNKPNVSSSDDESRPMDAIDLGTINQFEVFRTQPLPLDTLFPSIKSSVSPPAAAGVNKEAFESMLSPFNSVIRFAAPGQIVIRLPSGLDDQIHKLSLVITMNVRYDWSAPQSDDLRQMSSRPDALLTEASVAGSVSLGDQRLGVCVVDLYGLKFGKIEGWYHLMDAMQINRGQVNLSVEHVAGGDKTAETTAASHLHDEVPSDIKSETAESLSLPTVSELLVDEGTLQRDLHSMRDRLSNLLNDLTHETIALGHRGNMDAPATASAISVSDYSRNAAALDGASNPNSAQVPHSPTSRVRSAQYQLSSPVADSERTIASVVSPTTVDVLAVNLSFDISFSRAIEGGDADADVRDNDEVNSTYDDIEHKSSSSMRSEIEEEVLRPLQEVDRILREMSFSLTEEASASRHPSQLDETPDSRTSDYEELDFAYDRYDGALSSQEYADLIHSPMRSSMLRDASSTGSETINDDSHASSNSSSSSEGDDARADVLNRSTASIIVGELLSDESGASEHSIEIDSYTNNEGSGDLTNDTTGTNYDDNNDDYRSDGDILKYGDPGSNADEKDSKHWNDDMDYRGNGANSTRESSDYKHDCFDAASYDDDAKKSDDRRVHSQSDHKCYSYDDEEEEGYADAQFDGREVEDYYELSSDNDSDKDDEGVRDDVKRYGSHSEGESKEEQEQGHKEDEKYNVSNYDVIEASGDFESEAKREYYAASSDVDVTKDVAMNQDTSIMPSLSSPDRKNAVESPSVEATSSSSSSPDSEARHSSDDVYSSNFEDFMDSAASTAPSVASCDDDEGVVMSYDGLNLSAPYTHNTSTSTTSSPGTEDQYQYHSDFEEATGTESVGSNAAITQSDVAEPTSTESNIGNGNIIESAASSSSSVVVLLQSAAKGGDSPQTQKIRRLIDEELSKTVFVHAKAEAAPSVEQSEQATTSTTTTTTTIATIRESAPPTSTATTTTALHVASSATAIRTSSTSSAVAKPPPAVMNVADIVRDVMARHHGDKKTGSAYRYSTSNGISTSSPSSIASTTTSSGASAHLAPFPGRRKRFVDDEAGRISRIMLGLGAGK